MSVQRVQRRTISTLVAGQTFGAMGITVGLTTASLLARDLSGSEALAGSAQTTQVLGAAVASAVIARLMSRRGRRVGLTTAFAVGALGSAIAVVAGEVGSISLLLVGTFLLGSVTAASMAARFAATDLAEPDQRGKALSIVVWATTIGAVAGPNLTGWASSMALRYDLPELTGPFGMGAVTTLVAAGIIWIWLRPDPLHLARSTAPTESLHVASLREVLRGSPALIAAMAALAGAHSVMISVMVMTPLHMEHGGAELKLIGVVISIHIAGMFAFSPLVGWAVDRFGSATVLAASGVVLLVSLFLTGTSPEGHSADITVGLFLLGVGWSMATVAAATMVVEHAPAHSVTKVQGTADVVMNMSAAIASAFSGVVVGWLGFGMLSAFAAVFAVGVVASAGLARRSA